ncbi:MAG: hypothetical protein SGBAC_002436 [Bacillariaceae sp.]
MKPQVQESVISDIIFEPDFDDSDNWTHFHNNGNAFRSDFKSVSSSANTNKTSPTCTSASSDDDSFEDFTLSPLHRASKSSSPARKLMSKEEEQEVQKLVHAIRNEYQDANTEAGKRNIVSHLSRLKIRSKKQDFAVSKLSFQDSMDDRETSIAAANKTPTPTPVAKEQESEAPFTNASKKDEVFDPFTIAADRAGEDDDTCKPISFLNTSTESGFSDDDTLTLSFEGTEASEYEQAERIHAIKESVMDILMCTICSNPIALLTGNCDDVPNDALNFSNDEIHL